MDESVRIVVVFDNKQYIEGFQTGWGFSAIVEVTGEKILFDTGPDGSKLLANMDQLGIEFGSINTVVISHEHPDHTGGLEDFLKTGADVNVYMPAGLPEEFKHRIRKYGVEMIEVGDSVQICEKVYSTGQIGRRIKEQGLIVQTERGTILILGCAHPGVVEMTEVAKRIGGEPILLLMGGFHLEWSVGFRIKWIISDLKKIGVQYVAASHCTGDKAKRLLSKCFGDRYVNIGAGRQIKIDELK